MTKLKSKFLRAVLMTAVVVFPAASFAGVTFQPLMSLYSTDKDGLDKPEGVACSTALHEIVAADTGRSRLMRYTFVDGKVVDEKEIKISEVSYPVKVQLNSKGEIYVFDGKKRAIARLAPDGKFEGYIEPAGFSNATAAGLSNTTSAGLSNTTTAAGLANTTAAGLGELRPKSFKIGPDDNIYVLDVFGQRVLVLNPEGKYIRQMALPSDSVFIADLAVSATGGIVLTDASRAVLYTAGKDSASFAPLTGDLHQYIDYPSDITLDRHGVVYVIDKNGGRIIAIGQDGSFLGQLADLGWNEGFLYFPSQMCLSDEGYAIVADRENSRIQIFKILQSGS